MSENGSNTPSLDGLVDAEQVQQVKGFIEANKPAVIAVGVVLGYIVLERKIVRGAVRKELRRELPKVLETFKVQLDYPMIPLPELNYAIQSAFQSVVNATTKR